MSRCKGILRPKRAVRRAFFVYPWFCRNGKLNPRRKKSMADNLFIALIVLSVAGYILWNTRRTRSTPAPVAANREAKAAADVEASEETGVSKYLKSLPPAPVQTGVTRYLRNLPKPAPETGVSRYLKTLKAPEKTPTGVTRYINSVLATQAARRADTSFDALLRSIPAPTRESGVSRYVQAISRQ